MGIALDKVTFWVILWNFSVVGAIQVFFWPGPLFLKQGACNLLLAKLQSCRGHGVPIGLLDV
jgi:hypothetical protein